MENHLHVTVTIGSIYPKFTHSLIMQHIDKRCHSDDTSLSFISLQFNLNKHTFQASLVVGKLECGISGSVGLYMVESVSEYVRKFLIVY